MEKWRKMEKMENKLEAGEMMKNVETNWENMVENIGKHVNKCAGQKERKRINKKKEKKNGKKEKKKGIQKKRRRKR